MVPRRQALTFIPAIISLGVLIVLLPRFTVALLFLIYVPGRVLLGDRLDHIHPVTRWAAALIIGFTVLPVLTFVLGGTIKLVSTPLLIGYCTVMLAAFLWQYRGRAQSFSGDNATGVLGIILLLGIVTRLLPVIGMHAPLFSDPAVEGTFAQVLVFHGHLPTTWAPFAAMQIQHQPGFAVNVAALHLLSGVPIPRLILVLTNLLHALFPLAVAALARTVFRQQWTAVLAAGIALLAAFPTYTFVAGMNAANLGGVIAPVFAAILLSERGPGRTRFVLPFMVGVGLLLIHPFAFVIAAVLTAPFAAYNVFTGHWSLSALVERGVVGGIFPGISVLPYYLTLLTDSNQFAAAQWVLQSDYINPRQLLEPFHLIEPFFVNFYNPAGRWFYYSDMFSAGQLLFANPVAVVLIVLAAYSTYRIIREQDRRGFILLAVYALFLLFSTVQAAVRIPFPGHEFLYPSRFKFFIIIPIALLIVDGVRNTSQVHINQRQISLGVIAVLLVAPIALAAIPSHLNALRDTPVVGDGDHAAITWIDDNVDRSAVVFNTLHTVEAGAFIGGPGQWIPAYTGNPVVYPATSLTENVSRILARRQAMTALSNSDPRFNMFLDRYNVSYLFVSRHSMTREERSKVQVIERITGLCNCSIVYENQDATVLRRGP